MPHLQLQVAAAVTGGCALLHFTLRGVGGGNAVVRLLLPALWIAGAAALAVRLGCGVPAHLAAQFRRNSRRKRRLAVKLAALEVGSGGLRAARSCGMPCCSPSALLRGRVCA